VPDVAAVVVAAGRGERLGAGGNKAFVRLAGHPLLAYTLAGLEAIPEVRYVAVAVGPGEEELCRELIRAYLFKKVAVVVTGGASRQESVARALRAVDSRYSMVAVHDGARPFPSPALLRALTEAAEPQGAAVPAVPPRDTIKRVNRQEDRVIETLPREELVAVQTPQVFSRSLLEVAHARAAAEGFLGTDDAVLVERLGHPVRLVPGDYHNLKITTPEDLALAEFYLARGLVENPLVARQPGSAVRRKQCRG